MKKALVLLTVAALATVVHATDISSMFTNIDFDSGTTTSGYQFKGFDAVDGYTTPEIIGWTNYRNGAAGVLNDAGVEGPSGWWVDDDTLYNQAAFMSSGDAAYTMSTYTIQSGDVFTISYLAGWWSWTGSAAEWTATLFYDDPTNVIGTYVQGITAWFGDDVWYTDATGITATSDSVGHTLGILLTSTGSAIAQIDEVTVNVVPEPATMILLGLGGLSLIRRKK